jgi:arylsulfate sulfotransferase
MRSFALLWPIVLLSADIGLASSVNLQASSAEAPVGTAVHLSASTDVQDGSTIWYRYRVRRTGGEFHTVRDFGPQTDLDWTTLAREGTYEIEVTAQNKVSGETMIATSNIQVDPLTSEGKETVTPTANPLVFIFSAPPCQAGARMRVAFQSDGGAVTYTPFKDCAPDSLNFYLAGMLPQTTYHAHSNLQTLTDGLDGIPIDFTSGALPDNMQLPTYTITQSVPSTSPQQVLLQSPLSGSAVATDLNGNVLWYYPGYISLTRPNSGSIFGFVLDPTQDPSQQILREFDLAGVTIRETNAARVTEQLQAMGFQGITSFHHEVRALPGGRIMALGATEQLLTGVQGPGTVDVLGDMIVVMDSNLNVVWAWDAIQWLDPTRLATLGETCTPQGGGCPAFYLAPIANDWLHGNSLEPTDDGNILYSSRHQDWVVKISYDAGSGDGHILWRLGKDGDFTYSGNDPYPWFSHQHDAGLIPGDNGKITVFDDGNVRFASDNTSHSRGQVLQIDENSKTASLLLNADLGAYSYALGSAHRLANGDFHFELGILWGTTTSQTVEVDPQGNMLYQLQVNGPEYRTFRLQDLYNNGY